MCRPGKIESRIVMISAGSKGPLYDRTIGLKSNAAIKKGNKPWQYQNGLTIDADTQTVKQHAQKVHEKLLLKTESPQNYNHFTNNNKQKETETVSHWPYGCHPTNYITGVYKT